MEEVQILLQVMMVVIRWKSSAAGAIVAVGLIAYFVMNSGDDSEEAEFINETVERKFTIDFLNSLLKMIFDNHYFEQK